MLASNIYHEGHLDTNNISYATLRKAKFKLIVTEEGFGVYWFSPRRLSRAIFICLEIVFARKIFFPADSREKYYIYRAFPRHIFNFLNISRDFSRYIVLYIYVFRFRFSFLSRRCSRHFDIFAPSVCWKNKYLSKINSRDIFIATDIFLETYGF